MTRSYPRSIWRFTVFELYRSVIQMDDNIECQSESISPKARFPRNRRLDDNYRLLRIRCFYRRCSGRVELARSPNDPVRPPDCSAGAGRSITENWSGLPVRLSFRPNAEVRQYTARGARQPWAAMEISLAASISRTSNLRRSISGISMGRTKQIVASTAPRALTKGDARHCVKLLMAPTVRASGCLRCAWHSAMKAAISASCC